MRISMLHSIPVIHIFSSRPTALFIDKEKTDGVFVLSKILTAKQLDRKLIPDVLCSTFTLLVSFPCFS